MMDILVEYPSWYDGRGICKSKIWFGHKWCRSLSPINLKFRILPTAKSGNLSEHVIFGSTYVIVPYSRTWRLKVIPHIWEDEISITTCVVMNFMPAGRIFSTFSDFVSWRCWVILWRCWWRCIFSFPHSMKWHLRDISYLWHSTSIVFTENVLLEVYTTHQFTGF